VMLQDVRDQYDLESLWSLSFNRSEDDTTL
jgi:ribosomal silencing factor RsfS